MKPKSSPGNIDHVLICHTQGCGSTGPQLQGSLEAAIVWDLRSLGLIEEGVFRFAILEAISIEIHIMRRYSPRPLGPTSLAFQD